MKKVALITGGSRGIGFGIAKAMAKENFNLTICGLRDESTVQDTITELKELNTEVLYVRADIGKKEDRENLIATIRRKYDRIDLLVNNAGMAPQERKDLLEATEESFEKVLRVNLQGAYFLTQAVACWMINQKKMNKDFDGCIINISSISATVASTNRGEYCVAKAGLSMATQLWATRLGEFNIPVYEIRPGITQTDMTAGVKEKYDKLISEGLLVQSRWGSPEDVGKATALLARGDLSYSTGQVLHVDGGLTIPRL